MGTADHLEPLYVSCKNCGRQVPAGLHLTGAVYEIPVDREHELTCPGCGATAAYTKAQFHIATT